MQWLWLNLIECLVDAKIVPGSVWLGVDIQFLSMDASIQ